MKEQKLISLVQEVNGLYDNCEENVIDVALSGGWEIKQISTTSCQCDCDNPYPVVVYTLLLEREVE